MMKKKLNSEIYEIDEIIVVQKNMQTMLPTNLKKI